jgi:TatD DNase family protein
VVSGELAAIGADATGPRFQVIVVQAAEFPGSWLACSAGDRVIDSHTHLHLCEPSDAELVAAAVAAGVSRMVSVGTDGASCRAALAAAEAFPQVYAAVGRHPNAASGFDDADLAELEALAAHPRCVAIGETGLDYYREGAPAEDQRRAFLAQLELARRVGKPVVIHTRGADEETLALLGAHGDGLRVILHCFSMADRVLECLAHPDWWLSFAGNVTYPRNASLRDAALRVPAARLLVETDAPYLSPQSRRGRPNSPAQVTLTAAALSLARRVEYAELERTVEASATAVFGW